MSDWYDACRACFGQEKFLIAKKLFKNHFKGRPLKYDGKLRRCCISFSWNASNALHPASRTMNHSNALSRCSDNIKFPIDF